MTSISESKNLLTEGDYHKKLISFALPIFFGNLLQQLYNMVDSLIVGNFDGSVALAAVSSAGNLTFLIIGFFNGLALGAGAVVARFIGAKDQENTEKSVHTTTAVGIVSSILVTLIAYFAAPQILLWMGTPDNVLPESLNYFRIYALGCFTFIMYNIFVGILQGAGDSRHPLYYLAVASVLNVIMDYIFVAVFHMGAGGAALATVLAEGVCMVLSMIRLMHEKADYRLVWKKVRFHKDMLGMILHYGVPGGIQNIVISFANVMIQSYVNAFGSDAMAGIGSYARIEGFVFIPVTSFNMALTTYTSQNLGARKYDRVRKGDQFGMACSMILAESIGVVVFVFAPSLIRLFSREPEVIYYGVGRARICALFYFLLACSHSIAAVLRGAGRSVVPMVIMLVCWCLVRVLSLILFMPVVRNIDLTSWLYPITWGLSTLCYLPIYRNLDFSTL